MDALGRYGGLGARCGLALTAQVFFVLFCFVLFFKRQLFQPVDAFTG